MIRAVIAMNHQGKPRLIKFYDNQVAKKRQEIIQKIYKVLCRTPKHLSNFIQADSVLGPDVQLVCKTYESLHVVFVVDASENELAILDLIQEFLEALDECFYNREHGTVFSINEVHTVLNEMIFGGQVLGTKSSEVVQAVEDMSRLENTSNSIIRVAKSILGW